MQYFGGKYRISKFIAGEINKILYPKQPFVDLFCGSCNVISKVNSDRLRIANDKHFYLISMFKELQKGWIPPDTITEQEYYYIKQNVDDRPYLSGFVGFGCSFSGKWFGGYAKNKRNDNFCIQSKNSILKKIKLLEDVNFFGLDYKDVPIPYGSVVYCDIPYKNTTQYSKKQTGEFSHQQFYSWVIENKNNFSVYISEYKQNIPMGFEIMWELEGNKEIRNKFNVREQTQEVLIKISK